MAGGGFFLARTAEEAAGLAATAFAVSAAIVTVPAAVAVADLVATEVDVLAGRIPEGVISEGVISEGGVAEIDTTDAAGTREPDCDLAPTAAGVLAGAEAAGFVGLAPTAVCAATAAGPTEKDVWAAADAEGGLALVASAPPPGITDAPPAGIIGFAAPPGITVAAAAPSGIAGLAAPAGIALRGDTGCSWGAAAAP